MKSEQAQNCLLVNIDVVYLTKEATDLCFVISQNKRGTWIMTVSKAFRVNEANEITSVLYDIRISNQKK